MVDFYAEGSMEMVALNQHRSRFQYKQIVDCWILELEGRSRTTGESRSSATGETIQVLFQLDRRIGYSEKMDRQVVV